MVRQWVEWQQSQSLCICWPPTPALIMCSDWTVNTNQTGARPLPDTETKALITQPLAINLVLKRIDQITQTINWKRFTANWQYFTSFNFSHWPFLPETLRYKDCHDVCQEDTSHIVYRWPGNSFCQDGNTPPVLRSDMFGVHGRSTFLTSFQLFKGNRKALHLHGWNPSAPLLFLRRGWCWCVWWFII